MYISRESHKTVQASVAKGVRFLLEGAIFLAHLKVSRSLNGWLGGLRALSRPSRINVIHMIHNKRGSSS
jgi:hypothetical protein